MSFDPNFIQNYFSSLAAYHRANDGEYNHVQDGWHQLQQKKMTGDINSFLHAKKAGTQTLSDEEQENIRKMLYLQRLNMQEQRWQIKRWQQEAQMQVQCLGQISLDNAVQAKDGWQMEPGEFAHGAYHYHPTQGMSIRNPLSAATLVPSIDHVKQEEKIEVEVVKPIKKKINQFL